MELYITFQIKDHYSWTSEAPKPEVKVEATKPAEKPTYCSYMMREKDGSTTYIDPQVSRPVRINGIKI